MKIATECNQGCCPHCKPKPKYKVINEHKGEENYFLFCDKAQRDIMSEDCFPFPEWCPLTKAERKAG